MTTRSAVEGISPNGDTLLFYFAGHGSQYRDDEAHEQDTGYNGTILPSDARNPDGSAGDIFDVELKAIKDRAVAAGIYFVTVFDSCNSATATRDGAAGQARSVAPLTGALPPRVAAPAPIGPGGGYWVHLAAAQDGEEAQETTSGAIGTRAGVFTSALIDTIKLPGMRDASFGDIIKEVQLRVAQRGHMAQTPSAEGELTAAMGSHNRSPVLYDVRAASVMRPLDGELVDGPELVARHVKPIDQAHEVTPGIAVLLVLHRHTAHQQLVQSAVGRQQGWDAQVHHLLQGVFARCRGDAREIGRAHV